MMATNIITTPLSDRQLGKPDDILPFINKEAIPLLREMRKAINNGSTLSFSGNTADSPSAYKTVWESDTIADGTAGLIIADIVVMDTAGNSGFYERVQGYSMSAGVLTSVGTSLLFGFETAAALDGRIQLGTNTARVEVRDNGVAMGYEAQIRVIEAVAP